MMKSSVFIWPILLGITFFVIFNFYVVLYKIKLFLIGIIYYLFCNDKAWKKPADVKALFTALMQTEEGRSKIQSKTIVFVRHGESTWNDTFNKGSHRSAIVFALGFIPSFVKAILYELYLLLTGKMDSWFYDSPLSHLGIDQVKELSNFLQKATGDNPTNATAGKEKELQLIQIMRGDANAPASKLVSSNLRRAISTMAQAFHERLQKTPSDSILLLPCLQEISRNPDTLSLTPAFTPILASWIEKQRTDACNFDLLLAKQVDVRLNAGNKPLSTNGLKRMMTFCETVFSSVVKENYVIVGGHSIWFRSFFQAFLPSTSMHVSKRRKLVNAGCVSFTLMTTQVDGKNIFMIDESSIRVIYGGF